MNFDEIDIKLLRENFDDDIINQLDVDNVSKIAMYLNENGIFYAKDLIISSLDLFLLPAEKFIEKFEILKRKIGEDYIDKLGEDMSLIELMYED